MDGKNIQLCGQVLQLHKVVIRFEWQLGLKYWRPVVMIYYNSNTFAAADFPCRVFCL